VELASPARSLARRTFFLLGVLANTVVTTAIGFRRRSWRRTRLITEFPSPPKTLNASDISATLAIAILSMVSACVVGGGRWTVPASQPALDR
jgi:hypothetical protein